ncbi:MAG: hypothetical protein ACTSV0_05580 [Candidatus Freyarchaeota archaeon]
MKIPKFKDKFLMKELGIDDLKTTKKKIIEAVTDLVNSYETLWDLLKGCIRVPECAMNHELEIADVIEDAIGVDSDIVFALEEEDYEYEEEEEEEEEDYESGDFEEDDWD